MSRLSLFIRYVVFCVFFAVGTTAIVVSLLIEPEIIDYYHSRAILEKTLKDNQKMAKVTEQYKSQITLIGREPNVLMRIQQHTLGQVPGEMDTVYPVEYNNKLADMARDVLNEAGPIDPNGQIPAWIIRCLEPRYRTTLFLAGAGLILITFMFFGGPRKVRVKKRMFYAR